MNATASSVRRVLVLQRRHGAWAPPFNALDSGCEFVRAGSYDDAVRALREQEFDCVISETGDFLALERAAVNQQAAFILETIGQGVCVLDLTGRVVWHNQHMSQLPKEVVEKLSHQVKDIYNTEDGPHLKGPRRINIPGTHRTAYEIHLDPIMDHDGLVVRLAAVIEDATEEHRLRQRLDAIYSAGRELVCFERDSKLSVPERLDMVESRILKFVHDVLRYDKFCIRVLDKRDHTLRMLCSVGLSDAGKNLDLLAQPEGNGISGYVAATGESYICSDVARDPRYLIGIHNAQSSLTVPLKLHDRVVGVFNVESDQKAAFDEQDRQFAEIFGQHIALALDILDLLVHERHWTTGQLAEDVSRQLASPLNDIQTEAQGLIDDYLGNDELRRRLQNIIRQVQLLRTSVKEAIDPADGMLGAKPKTGCLDPILNDKTILVADDNDMLRETIADVLGKYGCVVSVAANGNEAHDLLARQDFDLILADIKMPGRNGYEIFAQAREKSQTLPVILMTGFGYDPNHSIVKASREGLSGVLFKPFKTEQLLEDIRNALKPAATPA